MSNFLNRLSNKNKPASPASPLSSQTKDESFNPVSPPSSGGASPAADEDLSVASGEEEEVEEEELATSGGGENQVSFTDERRSLVAQRLGVLPYMNNRSWGGYTEDDLKGTKIRGANYLKDKIKIPSGPALYRLSHADIFYTRKDEERITNVTKAADSYISSAHDRRNTERNNNIQPTPFSPAAWFNHPAALTIIINIVFPGPRETNMNLVMYYERRVPPADILTLMKEAHARNSCSSSSSSASSSSVSSNNNITNEFGDDTLNGVDLSRVRAFDTLLHRIRNGNDAYRDGKLKIIPRVAEGGYIVKKTIGRIPAILGKKVKQSYYLDQDKNSLEIIADIGTSKVAGKIISLIKNTCKQLVVDMTFLFQGDSVDELPESLLGGIRISHCDVDAIQHYAENKKSNAAALAAGGR